MKKHVSMLFSFIENLQDGRRWRSRFSASFVEEITRKTGNAKKQLAFDNHKGSFGFPGLVSKPEMLHNVL